MTTKAAAAYNRAVKRNFWAKHAPPWKCHWCGKKVVRKSKDRAILATMDHVKPLSKGGVHHLSNLVLACAPCNSFRGNQDLLQKRGA